MSFVSATAASLADEASRNCSEVAYRELGGEAVGYISYEHVISSEQSCQCFQQIRMTLY